MGENLITIGMILGIWPTLAVILDDKFDTFENGCTRMLFVQAIISVILILVGAGAMLGGE